MDFRVLWLKKNLGINGKKPFNVKELFNKAFSTEMRGDIDCALIEYFTGIDEQGNDVWKKFVLKQGWTSGDCMEFLKSLDFTTPSCYDIKLTVWMKDGSWWELEELSKRFRDELGLMYYIPPAIADECK